ncbi:hypothetical protein [Kribbella albertanoniae]|uniref:hypothetical protein n=1 Tax=Kribbella albertanoniae TaxID=1266829 RepID=UPI001404C719|nr:hypothetical protein [Kribbella albertanoniae]
MLPLIAGWAPERMRPVQWVGGWSPLRPVQLLGWLGVAVAGPDGEVGDRVIVAWG